METRVYYGAYTLEHWVKMLLNQELVLPEYQRSFKWGPDDIRYFINSLKDHQFVPSVTIGAYSRRGVKSNYIIDGQQRLTALLLAMIKFYPNLEQFRKQNVINKMNENDDEPEEDERLEWTFEKLITTKSDIELILRKCAVGGYDQFDCAVTPDFFTNTYLGFAYIVPQDAKESEQLPYFATVFRNINFQGIALSDMESRTALYYWKDGLTNWFEPPFLTNLFHNTRGQALNLDFVRYISMLTQYLHKGNNVWEVVKGVRSSLESYYEQYIYAVALDKDDKDFGRFTTLFPNENYQGHIEHLQQAIQRLGYADMPIDTIVKLDLYLFGLIYYVVLLHHQLNISNEQKAALIQQLDNTIARYTSKHKRSPAAKKWLRQRIADSIRIYRQYIQAE